MSTTTDIGHGACDSKFEKTEFGFYAELDKTLDLNEFSSGIANIVKRLQFTDYSFINLDFAATPQTALASLPKSMLNSYYKERLFEHDMIVQRGICNEEAYLSSTIHNYVNAAPFRCEMTIAMNKLYQLYKSFGFYDFLNVPFHNHRGRFLLTVTIRGTNPSDFRRNTKSAEQSLLLLAEAIEHVAFDNYLDLLPRRTTNTAVNAKPLRVLNTLANNDLTIDQVAQKLGISTVTVNQHLKTVRRALNVKTNYAAIRKCISEGLISFNKGNNDG